MEVWNGNVEVIVHVGVPHEADVADDGGAQVSLVARQVPHPVHCVDDRLLRQHLQLLVAQERPSQFQLPVHFGRAVCPGIKGNTEGKLSLAII